MIKITAIPPMIKIAILLIFLFSALILIARYENRAYYKCRASCKKCNSATGSYYQASTSEQKNEADETKAYYYYEDTVITPATHRYRVYPADKDDKMFAEKDKKLLRQK